MPTDSGAASKSIVHDLYGILRVSPTANATDIDNAYVELAGHPFESRQGIVHIAHSILSNEYKRAQYDRERLSYLYQKMVDRSDVSVDGKDAMNREIYNYATDLMQRVDDPNEKVKAQAIKKLAELRNEVEEYVEVSTDQRVSWTTSTNKVMRAAGNALCEVLVAAEDRLRELEDELGRTDGLGSVEPRNPDTDIPFLPSGLESRKLPSLPRSPTERVAPQSASKIGVNINSRKDVDSDSDQELDSASEAATEILGAATIPSLLRATTNRVNVHLSHRATASTPNLLGLMGALPGGNSATNDPIGVGLVEFQELHGLLDPTNKENDAVFALQHLAHVPPEHRRSTMPATLTMTTANHRNTFGEDTGAHGGMLSDTGIDDPFH